MSTQSQTPPPANPLAGQPSPLPSLVQLIQKVEAIHRELDQRLQDPQYIDRVAEAMLRRAISSDTVKDVLDRLLDERFTRLLSGVRPQHHDTDRPPTIVGMKAVLKSSSTPLPGDIELKVQQHAVDHPTHPLQLNFFQRTEGSGWQQIEAGDLAKSAVIEAIGETDCFETGRFYWVEFYQITDRRTGLANEVRVPTPTNAVVDPAAG